MENRWVFPSPFTLPPHDCPLDEIDPSWSLRSWKCKTPSNKHLAVIPGPQSDLGVWPQLKGQVPTTARCSQKGVGIPAPCDCAGLQIGSELSMPALWNCAGLQIGSGLWVELRWTNSSCNFYFGKSFPVPFIICHRFPKMWELAQSFLSVPWIL